MMQILDTAIPDVKVIQPQVLSADNKRQLWVPEGFAHGFYVMSETAEFVYKCTDYYAPEFDRSLLWNDKELVIEWPLVNGQKPLLSEKDENGVPFVKADTFKYIANSENGGTIA